MSRTIKTYDDMCAERERLKTLLLVQKQRVANDWTEVKEKLLPVQNAFGHISKMAKADKSNPAVSMGLKIASDLFLKNFVLAKAGWVAKIAVPFVVKNYSSHLIADKGRTFIGKIANILSRRDRRTSMRTSVNPAAPPVTPAVPTERVTPAVPVTEPVTTRMEPVPPTTTL